LSKNALGTKSRRKLHENQNALRRGRPSEYAVNLSMFGRNARACQTRRIILNWKFCGKQFN
jgi:hypothetical protein